MFVALAFFFVFLFFFVFFILIWPMHLKAIEEVEVEQHTIFSHSPTEKEE